MRYYANDRLHASKCYMTELPLLEHSDAMVVDLKSEARCVHAQP